MDATSSKPRRGEEGQEKGSVRLKRPQRAELASVSGPSTKHIVCRETPIGLPCRTLEIARGAVPSYGSGKERDRLRKDVGDERERQTIGSVCKDSGGALETSSVTARVLQDPSQRHIRHRGQPSSVLRALGKHKHPSTN